MNPISTPLGIDSLPVELLVKTSGNLRHDDLLAVARTNQQFQDVVKGNAAAICNQIIQQSHIQGAQLFEAKLFDGWLTPQHDSIESGEYEFEWQLKKPCPYCETKHGHAAGVQISKPGPQFVFLFKRYENLFNHLIDMKMQVASNFYGPDYVPMHMHHAVFEFLRAINCCDTFRMHKNWVRVDFIDMGFGKKDLQWYYRSTDSANGV